MVSNPQWGETRLCSCSRSLISSDGLAHGANRSSWHGGTVGTTIGKKKESFTDLGFVDDVVLLAEMLYVLISALEVMDREASPLDMTIIGPR